MGKAASSVGGALGHAAGQIKNLVMGPLGMIGLAGGLFTLGGALKAGIGKAQEYSFAIEKMQGLTNDTADSLAQLIAVTDNYGVSADRLAKVIGFTEKTLGNLATTAGGAAAFQAKFGFSIVDSAGKVLSFNDILLKAADYYNSGASQSSKAALAATLFGRSYADLVPILKLGSQGIRDAEAAAKDLGITLTSQNVKDLAAFRNATREAEDALTGLQLQIGLALVPTLTDLANSARLFISDHRGDIVAFFRNAVSAGKAAIGVIGQVAGTLSSAWNSIPGPLRDFLIKGLVADRTIKFLFGFSPVGALVSGIETALGRSVATGLAQAGLGKLFVQPVFVTNPGFGGLGSAAGAGGQAAAAAGGFLAPGLIPAAVAAATPFIMFYAIPALVDAIQGQRAKGAETAAGRQLGLTTGQANTMAGVGLGNLLASVANAQAGRSGGLSPEDRDARAKVIATLQANADRADAKMGAIADIAAGAKAATIRALDALHIAFRDGLAGLRRAFDPVATARAAAQATSAALRGVGNVAATRDLLSLLRSQRTQAARHGETQLVHILDADIAKISARLAGREWIAAQLAKADKIDAQGKATTNLGTLKTDIGKLKDIQADLKAKGDTKAAGLIGEDIKTLKAKLAAAQDAAKAAIVSAQYAAAAGTNATIRANRPITNVQTIVNVTASNVTKAVSTSVSYGTPTSASSGGGHHSGVGGQ